MPSKALIAVRLPIRRGLDENEAAIYLSFSPSFFRKLVGEKRMPRPRLAEGRRIWDVEELDLAFKALPREGGEAEVIFVAEEREEVANPWDDVLR
jgi:hypothetical protein